MHHETGALVGTTRKCGPPPFVGGEPVGITRAVDRRARDERPHDGSGRLQRRLADVVGAPFDADPRRGASRRGNPVRIVNASGLACYRAEAHANVAAGANAQPLIDPDADAYAYAYPQPYVIADADPDLASDADPNGHPDPHADADPIAHADADTHPHANAYPRTRRGHRDRRR